MLNSQTFLQQCFAHLMPVHQDTKIDPRAYAAIFLGYDLNKKAYRLLDPRTKSLFLSRSVRFTTHGRIQPPTVVLGMIRKIILEAITCEI
jgi:hypothetical protein